jgi:prepilin-type N-terminal cleavage/methylation domain-containing protein
MKWKLQEDHKGFTLIELLVSVAILAFVVAPFLGSFVAAGESNVKSKRKQEATDLGQLLAEEFMAKDFEKLSIDYGMPKEETTADVKKYTFRVDTKKLPDAYRAVGYSAEVILEPTKHATVNNETITPQINSAEGGNMAVVMKKFYEDDANAKAASSDPSAYRKSTVTISKAVDTNNYIVSILIEYYVGNTLIYSDSKGPTNLYYQMLPSIYLLYLPYNADNDIIVIDNQLTKAEQNNQKLDVYIAQQIIEPKKLPTTHVWVNDFVEGSKTLAEIADENTGIAEKINTRIYSNLTGNMVPLINEKTLYDMTINIYTGDKKVSSVKTTKNIAD